ncbi:MAG: bifunctional adenosylcobinamide kinase/adenosylcobinamide-phosphate guanylyltransferase [bacterium]
MSAHGEQGGPGILFITGGARSGKSGFVLRDALNRNGRKLFIATAEPLDREMRERIEHHKNERGGVWETHEAPVGITDALTTLGAGCQVVVIDCLTLWLSNLMHRGLDIEREMNHLVETLQSLRHSVRVYIVSNEVGMGIVPDNELGRAFRDAAGRANQRIAEIADQVYMVVSGIPVKIKEGISD